MGKTLTDLLAVYLYQNRYLSLPKLGRFEVSKDEDLSQPEEIRFTRIPNGVITFTSNPQEETDTDLIKYITSHTRKMQSLAVADLFTFTDQALQLLNIYQPVAFPGIGKIKKNTQKSIDFEPGIYRPELLKNLNEPLGRTSYSESSTSASSYRSSRTPTTAEQESSRSVGGLLIILICVIIAGALIYFIFSNQGEGSLMNVVDVTREEQNDKKEEAAVLKKDSLQKEAKKETLKFSSKPPKTKGEIHYQVVFEHNVDSSRAYRRYRQLTGWGYEVVVFRKDNQKYNVAIPITSLVTDTAKVKDSISVLYGSSTTIRYKTGN